MYCSKTILLYCLKDLVKVREAEREGRRAWKGWSGGEIKRGEGGEGLKNKADLVFGLKDRKNAVLNWYRWKKKVY